MYTLDVSDRSRVRIDKVAATPEFTKRHSELYLSGLLDHPYEPEEIEAYRLVPFDRAPDGNSTEVREMFAD